jgi:excisionase family DNA binding protein
VTVKDSVIAVPDPRERPTVSIEEVYPWLGISRGAAYEAARRGELPVIRIGRRLLVPTAELRKMLGLDGGRHA